MANKSTIVRSIQMLAPITSAISPPLAGLWLQRLFTTPIRYRAPEREKTWLASARRSTLAHDEHQLAVYEWFVHEPRGTVLLVHGWSGRASQLGKFVEPLLEQGMNVLAFDAPGHGRAEGNRLALPQFARAVAHVVAERGPVHAVIAHSLGTAATSLALVDGMAAQRVVYVSPPDNPGNYLRRTARMLNFPEGIAPRAQRRMERKYGVPFESARGSHLAPKMDLPLLVVHDQEDRDVPFAEGERLVQAWRGATMLATRGLGHTRILRDDTVVRRAVEFATAA